MNGEMKELTRRQTEYLLIVSSYSFRCQLTEIAELMNVSLPSAHTTLLKLMASGYVSQDASGLYLLSKVGKAYLGNRIAVMQKLYLWIRWTLGIDESHALLQAAALTACFGKESCEAVLRAAAEGILSCGEKQKKTTPDQRRAEEALRKPRRRKIQPFGTEHPVMLRSGDPSARGEVPPDAVSIL